MIEAKYEAIRFIEHGARCRPSMDNVAGELLIYRVRDHPQITKEQLFTWFGQLLEQLIQYHRCYENQNYRYVNPYSVLVTRDGKILLLDLDAESNGFVLRNLQKRATRAHFVKPIAHLTEGSGDRLDLYGYGKTIQFILANTNVEPSLSKFQENKLERIINKCLNESKGKQYQELKEVEKELPVVHEKIKWKVKKDWIFATIAVLGSLAAVCSWIFVHQLTQKQERMMGWLLEMEQQLEAENEKADLAEIQKIIDGAESELREEVDDIQENVKSVNELLQAHLSEAETKNKENEELEEEKMENEEINHQQKEEETQMEEQVSEDGVLEETQEE